MSFRNMTEVVPEGRSGSVQVVHFTVSLEEAKMASLRAAINRRPDLVVSPGSYCKLLVGDTIMMTDTDMERRSNAEALFRAKGDVLIAGLGIGMILLPILEKPTVTSVTVLEKSPDVVALVEPHIRKASTQAHKLSVLLEDVWTWKPPKGRVWDVIYFDIWPFICTDNLQEIGVLHRRFARRKVKGGWMSSWQVDRLKSVQRRRGY